MIEKYAKNEDRQFSEPRRNEEARRKKLLKTKDQRLKTNQATEYAEGTEIYKLR